MGEKKEIKKNAAAAPEKYFAARIEQYFSFHKSNFVDEDGYPLSPNWGDGKRGMEMRSLKLLIGTLREICEGKKLEWTEEKAHEDFERFMEKSQSHSLVRKNFLCCMMNRFKFDILSSTYNPALAKKIKEQWYRENPDYTRVEEKDYTASEIIVGFFKQQFVLAGIEFTEQSMLASMGLIIRHIKADPFWCAKSLRSISNNMQEFVNKIKANKNGGSINQGGIKQNSLAPKSTGGFGQL